MTSLDIDLAIEHDIESEHDINVVLLDEANATPAPEKISLTKPELLEKFLDSFKAYRIYNKRPEHHTFKIHLQSLTHFIVKGTFETERGFTSDPNWSAFYARIKYTLTEFVEPEANEFYITPAIETLIQSYLNGAKINGAIDSAPTETNKTKAKKLAEFYINLNFEDFIFEEQITVIVCKICDKRLQQYEVRPHMKNHTLSEFMQEEEEDN